MRKNQKGFTLVELLVVIAILAILATVAVVGYSSFIESANKSVDQQVVAQMNTALQAASVESMPKNRTELLKLFDEHDIDINKLAPVTEGYAFYWDQSENKIVIVKNGDAIESDWEYLTSNGFGTKKKVSTEDEFTAAIAASSKTNPVLIQFANDVQVTDKEKVTVNDEKCVIIDLNEHTLSASGNNICAIKATDNATVTVKNGKIEGVVGNVSGNLTLDHVIINGRVYIAGVSDTYISNKCEITSFTEHTIGTNNEKLENSGIRLYISDSTITATAAETAGINITVNGDVTIDHCTVTGVSHGAYFRGCNATIKNSTFSHSSTDVWVGNKWGAGNEGRCADIVFACGSETGGFASYGENCTYIGENVDATTVIGHKPEGGTLNVSGFGDKYNEYTDSDIKG